MRLTNEQLKAIYCGALWFDETEDGYLQSYQHTPEQIRYFKETKEFWYVRSFSSTAKTLEFTTEATAFSMDYKVIWMDSRDSIDLLVNGEVVDRVYAIRLKKEGTLSFALPEGEKQVMLYLPVDTTVLLKNFEINGEVTPVKKNEKVLWMGDSITQGYGPLRSSCSYVSVANRILNYDIINQGIGGYVYDKNVLMKMMDYMPDKIIISLGTNQHRIESMTDVEEYYERLMEIYGITPVLCITPLWRSDVVGSNGELVRFSTKLKAICAKYPNVTVVDGFGLIPNEDRYFLDGVHPNTEGAYLYGTNLAAAIKEAGF